MTAKNTGTKDTIWSHQGGSNKDLLFPTMVTGLVTLIIVIFLRANIEAVLSTLLLVAFTSMAVFLTQSTTTNIEIDRERATVIKTTNYRIITTRKKYQLGGFDQVALLIVEEPVEDAYRTIRYSLVLSGSGQSLELVSTDTESEGKAIQKELAEFLGMPSRGEANSHGNEQ